MGKLRRRERRERQAERATEAGDLEALRAIWSRAPERVVEPLVKQLSRQGELDAAVLTFAEQTATLLRRKGQYGAVIELAQAGASRSMRLRAEGVLAAIAAGDDARARALADNQTPILDAFEPILAALNGQAPVRRMNPAPLVQGLFAVAKAVHETCISKRERAKVTLKAIGAAVAPLVWAEQFRAAVEVAHAARVAAEQAARTLLTHAPARSHAPLVEAVVREALARDAQVQLTWLLKECGIEGPPLKMAGAAAVAMRLDVGDSTPKLAAAIGTLGHEAFDEGERGRAAVYEGFALLQGLSPATLTRAISTFDRAVALGADLDEALRGKMLAYRKAGSASDFAQAAERFAHVVKRDPDGAALAVLALELAAVAWKDSGRIKELRTALAAARSLLTGRFASESVLSDLDKIEFGWAIRADVAAATAIVERMIARDATRAEAWKLRLQLAQRRGDQAEIDRVAIEAAEATREETFANLARTARGRAGQLALFAEMMPGAASAVQLAAEMLRAAAQNGEYPTRAKLAPFEAYLSPDDRFVVQAAALGVLQRHGQVEAAKTWWQMAASDALSSPARARTWIDVACLVKMLPDAVAMLSTLGSDDAHVALTAMVEAVGANDPTLYQRAVGQVSAHIPAKEVKKLVARRYGPFESTQDATVRMLTGALGPSSTFSDAKRVNVDRRSDEVDTPCLHEMLDDLGLPCDAIHELPASEQRRLEQLVEELATMPDIPARADGAEELIRMLRIPRSHIARVFGPSRPKRRRGAT